MPTAPRSPFEFELPGATPNDDILSSLRATSDVMAEPSTTAEWTYLDTFDGRLSRAGLTFELPRRPRGRLFVEDLPASALRSRIEGLVEMRALLPQARVRSVRQEIRVLDGERKTVCRLLVERPALIQPGQDPKPLSARLTIRPVRGYDRALDQVSAALARLPDLRPAERPLVDEAVMAAGGTPGGISAKIGVALPSDMRADEATVALCQRLAAVVEANLPGTLADTDTEFLHDLRVAVRRTRSILRQMKGVLPSEGAERARLDLRWIQEVTGPTRDLDVLLLGWPAKAAALPPRAADDLDPLHEQLQLRRAAAFAQMRRHLRSRRFAEAWHAWNDLLGKPLDPAADPARPNADRPVAEVAGRRIATVYRSMVRMGKAVGDDSPAEALHDLRKRGKELRYLLELYGQLWPGDVIATMIGTMKRLQDVLGRFQDDEVQADYLRSLAPELASAANGTDAVIALGQVIGNLHRDQHEARASFAKQFAPFAAARTQRLVGTTFGLSKRSK